MKTLIAAVFALTAASSMAQNKPLTETYNVDTKKTTIEWSGTKAIGGGHKGNVFVKKGTVVFQGDLITGGTIVVDMDSITVSDITPEKGSNDLIAHLKSPDFFDTAKPENKEATLTIKNSKKTANGLEVTADLTLRGKTNPVDPFLVKIISKDAKSVTGTTTVSIDRTKHGVEYNSASWTEIKKLAKEKVIDHRFTLNINLTATK